MTRLKIAFNARLARDFVPANDNTPKLGTLFPLEAEQISEEVEMAVAHMLKALGLPRRATADKVANAIHFGRFDIRWQNGDHFTRGYEIEDDLSSDFDFTWIRDLIDWANGFEPLPPLTDLMKRRLNLLVLWLQIDHPSLAERLPIKPVAWQSHHK